MAAVGDLNNFIKYQLAQGFEKDGAMTAGLGAEMAVGLTMAQQMMRQQPPASPILDILTPSEVATLLHVSEADVVASLEAGDLKGKRFGSQWRVTRSAVDDFLR
jgi:excisionase family DNA binding protein